MVAAVNRALGKAHSHHGVRMILYQVHDRRQVSRVLFVDDRDQNVAAPIAAGIHALHFLEIAGADALRQSTAS